MNQREPFCRRSYIDTPWPLLLCTRPTAPRGITTSHRRLLRQSNSDLGLSVQIRLAARRPRQIEDDQDIDLQARLCVFPATKSV